MFLHIFRAAYVACVLALSGACASTPPPDTVDPRTEAFKPITEPTAIINAMLAGSWVADFKLSETDQKCRLALTLVSVGEDSIRGDSSSICKPINELQFNGVVQNGIVRLVNFQPNRTWRIDMAPLKTGQAPGVIKLTYKGVDFRDDGVIFYRQ